MTFPSLKTTAPAAAQTTDARAELPMFWLVIVQCEDEPWRIGQCSPYPPGVVRCIGRGALPIEDFSSFDFHRPGDPLPPCLGMVGCLGGDKFSRLQAKVEVSPVGLVIQNLGRATMVINGEEVPPTIEDGEEVVRGTAGPGERVTFVGAGTFLCVLRPPAFPALQYATINHRFGEPDAAGNVGEGPEMWRVRDEAARLGRGNDFILIFGETGVGKTGVANLIHLYSARAKGPFIARNCLKLSADILEPELFGKVPNYPSPGPGVPGLLPSADGGTLFLDEIGRLLPAGQGSLLCVLDDGYYERLGEAKRRKLDVRFIGATNLTRSALQPDFHPRFKGEIFLEPVRGRKEDIPLLVREMLLRRLKDDPTLMRLFVRSPDGDLYPRVSGSFIEFLMRHELPGNTRELDTIVGAAIPAPGSDRERIELPPRKGGSSESVRPSAPAPSSVPSSGGPSSAPSSDAKSRATKEKVVLTKEDIVAALEAAGGNVSEAARTLGAQRNLLIRMMEKLKMIPPKE